MITFSNVSKIFELSGNYNLRFHHISSMPFTEFSLSLKKLEHKIQNCGYDDILLNDLLTYFRKFRYILSASLLPFSAHGELINSRDLSVLSRQCQMMYQDIKENIDIVMKKYEILRTSSEKPVLDYLWERFKDRVETGIVLRTASDLEAIEVVLEQTFSKDNSFSIVTPSKLKKGIFFERLIILGPTYWYPEYLFHCPRSSNIEIIVYDFQLNRDPRMEYFIESHTKISSVSLGCNIQTFRVSDRTQAQQTIEVSDQIIDYKKLEKGFIEKPTNATSEYVSAKLIGLTEAKGIFFEDHSIRNIWTISLHSEQAVTKRSVNELDTHSYLLIRSGTGRDLIQIKADEFLGKKRAERIRYHHSIWKKRLRKYLFKYHAEKICRYLQKNGGKRANEINIRNWISDDNIKPREYNDFLAIMRLVKLEEHAERLWKEAEELFRAHQRAGMVIRKLLIKKIKNSNLGKLELEQKMTFSLPDYEDATFTAYKIEYISQGVFKVKPHQVRTLIELNHLGGH